MSFGCSFCALLLSQEYEALKEEVVQLSAHHDELERKLKALRQSREEKERKVSERREGREEESSLGRTGLLSAENQPPVLIWELMH